MARNECTERWHLRLVDKRQIRPAEHDRLAALFADQAVIHLVEENALLHHRPGPENANAVQAAAGHVGGDGIEGIDRR